jgi:transglutaminase-like putative cysteine protease/glutamine cyclotransferase
VGGREFIHIIYKILSDPEASSNNLLDPLFMDSLPFMSDASIPLWWLPEKKSSQMAQVHEPNGLQFTRLQPLGASALEGVTVVQDRLWVLDYNWGYLFELDPVTGQGHLCNPKLTYALRDTYALASSENLWLWVAQRDSIYRLPLQQIEDLSTLENYYFCRTPFPIEGLDVDPSGIYATCYQREKILHLDPKTGVLIQEFPAPGVGREHLAIQGDYLWVSDRREETLYILDRKTGQELGRILTPFPGPTGLTFWRNQLWVAYTSEEAYIQDNPNAEDPLSVGRRTKTWLAPLRLNTPQPPPLPPLSASVSLEKGIACPISFHSQFNRNKASYTLSGGYRVELTYLEEWDPEDPQMIPELIWKIALPCSSLRQRVESIQAVGVPFSQEYQLGQRIAVFNLGKIQPGEARLFGWQAVLDLYNLKYCISPDEVETIELPQDLTMRYLMDDDNLAMDSPIVQEAAREAIGTETNLLRKLYRIREYVYDTLSYRVTSRIEAPDQVLRQGTGSCGEYVGVLLALARLNGIVCRTVGRYKCPPYPDLKGIPLLPQYNHVWIEFYLPGWGWIPMESNPDDTGDRPYPQRYFMGLPWTHAEIAKGIPFESSNADVPIGQLAINHVQFRILDEL